MHIPRPFLPLSLRKGSHQRWERLPSPGTGKWSGGEGLSYISSPAVTWRYARIRSAGGEPAGLCL